MGTRLKEHTKTTVGNPTAVGEHIINTGHTITPSDTKIVAREEQFWRRKIHESITIIQQQPTMNRDSGYHLPALYKTLLSRDTARAEARAGEARH